MALLGHDVSAALFVSTQEGGRGRGRGGDKIKKFLQLYDVIVLRRKGWCRIWISLLFFIDENILIVSVVSDLSFY